MNPTDEPLNIYPGKEKAHKQPVLSQVHCRTEECEIELNIGVFFKGTGVAREVPA